MDRISVLIVGHGSRETGANVEFETLVARYQAARPDLHISHGYVELAEPSLETALVRLGESGAKKVLALPLFLFAASHVKNDIPLALDVARRRFPHASFVAARVLGVEPRLVQLLYTRAMETDLAPSLRNEKGALRADVAARTAVVIVGRGASDPDVNGDFCKLVRLFGEGRGFSQVVPCFIGIARPLVEETLEQVARARPEKMLIVPYMLYGGRLVAKLAEQVRVFSERYSWIRTAVAPHLGNDPLLFSLLDDRLREADEGSAPLPCDNCQYRIPLPGREEQVGGLQAMLYSLRHGYTHTQAIPHVHAHRALRKHVLVCGNVDCAERGSIALIESVRRLVKDAGRERDIKVTRTSCMGRCGEGPTVAVYPDGIWYRGVSDADAAELVHEHLLGDRLVARLVDNIMQ